ncbi:MAG TPA: VWA domain-containing protein [Acidobacteriaceae bacterium]|nr:VWA domain-containing protein [Acidobacteriaceae bacterium]
MRALGCLWGAALLLLLSSTAASAQLGHPDSSQSRPSSIHLDIVVTGRDGVPVAGLQKSDFTVLDNGVAQQITSFQPMTGDACPVEVIILVDTVNPNYTTVAFERQQMDKFFGSNGGKLPYPTSVAIFSDEGAQIMRGFTRDGASLAKVLDQQAIGLRAIRRSAGVEGASERTDMSLQVLRQLIAAEGPLPGRKIILWMSPGWPFLSGPEIELGVKQQRGLFREIQDISTELRQARITLYAIDPLGTSGSVANYYENFIKPVRKPGQAQFGNLSLQVLAVHSGGLVFRLNNDIAGLMQKSVDDVSNFYELSYTPPGGEPNEFHSIRVKIAKPDLKARTRAGYYSGY